MNSPTCQTRRRIFMLDGSNDMDSRKDVPFGGFVDIAPHFGLSRTKDQKLCEVMCCWNQTYSACMYRVVFDPDVLFLAVCVALS